MLRLFDKRFEEALKEQVEEVVSADHRLREHYGCICRARAWQSLLDTICCLLGVLACFFGVRALLLQWGDLNADAILRANLVGGLAPLGCLMFLWRLIRGPRVLSTLPRLPMSDAAIFSRAWRQHSATAFGLSFVIWCAVYFYLGWYGQVRGAPWYGFVGFAAVSALMSMSLCNLLSLLSYGRSVEWSAVHVWWLLLMVLGWTALNYPGGAWQRELTESIALLLPTRFVTESYGAHLNGEAIAWHSVLMTAAGGLFIQVIAKRLHRAKHPLLVGPSVAVEVEEVPQEPDEWSLAEENTSFWKAGFAERWVAGFLNARERIVVEGISRTHAYLTMGWIATVILTVASGIVVFGAKFHHRDPGTALLVLPLIVIALYMLLPPMINFGERGAAVLPNPFPFLPVVAGELFRCNLKISLLKGVLILPQLAFLFLQAKAVHPDETWWHLVAIYFLWMLVGSAVMPLYPLMNQWNFAKRYHGWMLVSVFLSVFLVVLAGPSIFGWRGEWLLFVQPIVVAYFIVQISLWAWKRGIFDYDCKPIDRSGEPAESVSRNQAGID